MFCTKCGSPLPDGAEACGVCEGKKALPEPAAEHRPLLFPVQEEPPEPLIPKKRIPGWALALAILGLLVLLSGLVVTAALYGTDKRNDHSVSKIQGINNTLYKNGLKYIEDFRSSAFTAELDQSMMSQQEAYKISDTYSAQIHALAGENSTDGEKLFVDVIDNVWQAEYWAKIAAYYEKKDFVTKWLYETFISKGNAADFRRQADDAYNLLIQADSLDDLNYIKEKESTK